MREPTLSRIGNELRYNFQDSGVIVTARRPFEERHRIFAEIEIELKPEVAAESDPRVFRGIIGLLSKTGIKDAVDSLKEQRSELPWRYILSKACSRAQDDFKQRAKGQHIGDKSFSIDRPIYQLNPLLQMGQPTILYGDSGVGKSMVAAWMGVLVGNGIQQAGLTPTYGHVAYVDWETDEDTLLERIQAIKASLALAGEPVNEDWTLTYYSHHRPLTEWADDLSQDLAEAEIDLVIIDSMGMALGADFNDGATVVEFFRAVKSLNATTLIIDHQGKGEGARDKGPIGSTYKKALARSVWEIRKVEDTDAFQVGLHHRKVNRGRLSKPFGLEITITEDENYITRGVTFSRIEVTDSEELAGQLNLPGRLRAMLSRGAMQAADIKEALPDERGNTIDQILSRGVRQGWLTRLERGIYGLSDTSYDRF